jgi:LTXXQ motif family protein
MIKRRAKKSLHAKPVKGKAKAKPGLVAKSKARQRKRVHRVARGKPEPGHIVGHSRRRRKGEILCHNHVFHTAATANGVHGFHWLTGKANDDAHRPRSACPAETALTPTGRMTQMRARLSAVRQATTAIRPAFTQFYEALDQGQKVRFAAMH